jgi:hypothetical protein
MLRVLRNVVFVELVSLSLLIWCTPQTRAGDPTWGRVQASGQSGTSNQTTPTYYYNNAARTSVAPAVPSVVAPNPIASNSPSVTYRSYSPDPASNAGSYYYSPGCCGCYSYTPGPPPAAAAQATSPSGTIAATATAPNSGTYRSFSAEPVATPSYAYPSGYYTYRSSGGGHSWGGRR